MNKRVIFGILTGGMLIVNQAVAADKTDPADTKTAAPAVTAVAPAAPVSKTMEPAAAKPAVPTVQKPAAETDDEPNPAICFARGLSNICLCWLELPRCIIYDNYAIPFFGLLVGIPEGVLLTVVRAGSGIFDVISLGFSGNALYGKNFPDCIWQSKWKPVKK
ncbi:MAG: hypothetical protein PHH77_01930 [Victivallaceae bacterium]|nr:hypothetical protein [Victivallaceae bacterium]